MKQTRATASFAMVLFFLCAIPASSLEIYDSTVFGDQVIQIKVAPGQDNFIQQLYYDSAFLVSENGRFTLGEIPFNYYSMGLIDFTNPKQLSEKWIFSSRILEAGIGAEPLPGFIIDIGKKKFETGSGFFKSPTDFFSVVPSVTDKRSGASSDKTREGTIGAQIQYYQESWGITDYFSPAVTWDESAYPFLDYFQTQQPDWRNLIELSLKIMNADFDLLGLYENDSVKQNWKLGTDLVFFPWDFLEMHLDASLVQSASNLVVTDLPSSTVEYVAVDWYPQVLAGFVWSINENAGVMCEYYYNGRGLSDGQLADVFEYTKNEYVSGSMDAFDVMQSYGTFGLSKHYLMERLSYKIAESKLAIEVLNINSLSDWSGFAKMGVTWEKDSYNFTFAIRSYYGSPSSEFGIVPYNWELSGEIEIFIL